MMDVMQLPGTIPDKLQPHDIEAEEALLGATLIDQGTLLKTSYLRIAPADFFIDRHGDIWEAMLTLNSKGTAIDLLTLTDLLESRGQLKSIGGPAVLSGLINRTPSGLYGEYYAKIVKRCAVKRQLIAAAGEISRAGFKDDETEPEQAIHEAQAILARVSGGATRSKLKTMPMMLNGFLDRLEQIKSKPRGLIGLPTGLTELDRVLGGLQRGDLIVLAGVPGAGKSALALQVAIETSRNYEARVLSFSREMSAELLCQRMIAYDSGLDVQAIRTGSIKDDEYQSIFKAMNSLEKLPFVIDDQTATVEMMQSVARIECEQNGLDLVIVDYIQRVNGDGRNNRAQEVGAIVRGLKSLARDLNVPVIAISSMSRAYASRSTRRPIMSDLKDSGDIESEADVIIFVHRDEIFDKETEFPNVTDLFIEKHRQGPVADIQVFFKKSQTKFVDLEVKKEALDWIK